jgi:hypothetical protein
LIKVLNSLGLLLDGETVDVEGLGDLPDDLKHKFHEEGEGREEHESSKPALWDQVVTRSSLNLESLKESYMQ